MRLELLNQLNDIEIYKLLLIQLIIRPLSNKGGNINEESRFLNGFQLLSIWEFLNLANL